MLEVWAGFDFSFFFLAVVGDENEVVEFGELGDENEGVEFGELGDENEGVEFGELGDDDDVVVVVESSLFCCCDIGFVWLSLTTLLITLFISGFRIKGFDKQ